ncbi:hypothetical protein CH63R_04719 [Colletotrichum higginsianum IMI 349063]|uniref:Uncharacterized protein n=1 Tax=Colletotrichum higginsianum (strain IMI 349063) TaxID=759273 RepID=A0A1B7YK15_COLHI|nr:hypothetical protein CH63R_04719 [Colletotrichum higginsianum IMI 349063]OBR12423.1 hypothetical protein CH63R_04719 [Colletotrichum higginsianum IMI 349063]
MMPNPAEATIRISISTSSPAAATVRADRFATKAKQTEGLEGLPGQGEKGVDAWGGGRGKSMDEGRRWGVGWRLK